MGVSKSSPNTWTYKNGNGKTTVDNVFGGPGGWYIKHPNGQIELLQAIKGIVESPVNPPNVDLVVNPAAGDYSVGDGDTIQFVVNWSEPVVITGTPQIAFEENGSGVTADYVAASSSSTQSVFEFDVTTEGAIDTVTTTISLNGGTISGADTVAAVLDDPVYTDDTLTAVDVLSGGGGYTQAETITIEAPTKANSTATITTTDNAGVVDSVTLEDGGYGYEDADTIGIAGGNSDATVDITVVDGVITAVAINDGGTGYTGATGVELDAPSLTVTQAVATPVWESGLVPTESGTLTDVILEDGGYGYANGTITISGGTSGTITATVTDSVITSAVLLAGGTAYSGTTGVALAAPTKATSLATFNLAETGGVVDSVTLVTGGFGYETGEYAIPGGNGDAIVEVTAVDGIITVFALKAGSEGTGYTAGSGISFSAGTLVNSTATVTLKYATGILDSITIGTAGYGYDGTETVTLADPVGDPALLGFNSDYEQPTGVTVVA